MASGCIVGECPVCNDWIYEDEWDLLGDIILHERCLCRASNEKEKDIRIKQLEQIIKDLKNGQTSLFETNKNLKGEKYE